MNNSNKKKRLNKGKPAVHSPKPMHIPAAPNGAKRLAATDAAPGQAAVANAPGRAAVAGATTPVTKRE
eukprot:4850969-Pyramimonas_sp.AAC.1